jgi:hypothetical protein
VTVRKQYHFWPGPDGLDAWDVEHLISSTADLPIISVALADIPEIDSVYWYDTTSEPTVRSVVEHLRLIQEVDPSLPVILGPDHRVMDGMHRIARALLEGRSSVAAVRMTRVPPPDHRGCRPEDLPYD